MLSEPEARQLYASWLQLKPEIIAYGIGEIAAQFALSGVELMRLLIPEPDSVTMTEIKRKPELWKQFIEEVRSKLNPRS